MRIVRGEGRGAAFAALDDRPEFRDDMIARFGEGWNSPPFAIHYSQLAPSSRQCRDWRRAWVSE